jgi:hypothetical protein
VDVSPLVQLEVPARRGWLGNGQVDKTGLTAKERLTVSRVWPLLRGARVEEAISCVLYSYSDALG